MSCCVPRRTMGTTSKAMVVGLALAILPIMAADAPPAEPAAPAPPAPAAGTDTGGGGSSSDSRVTAIRQLITDFARQQDLIAHAREARSTVLETAQRELNVDPYPTARPLDEQTVLAEAAKAVDERVGRKYPPLDLRKLETEAAAKYPVYEVGQMVSVVYQASPARKDEAKGTFRGRTPDGLVIGSKRVLTRDLAVVKGNERELLKFNPEATNQLRRAYVEEKQKEYGGQQDAFRKGVYEVIVEETRKTVAARNEGNGFTFLDGRWETLPTVVRILVDQERTRLRQQREEEQKRLLAQQAKPVEPTPGTTEATTPKPTETTEATAHPETPSTPTEVAATPETPAVAVAPTPPTPPAPEPTAPAEPTTGVEPTATDSAIAHWVIPACMGAGVLVLLALVVTVALGVRSRPKGIFYVSRPDVEAKFWPLVEANRAEFRHVAFRFSEPGPARAALMRLSFIEELTTGGRLTSPLPIHFGMYEEDEPFVVFVGGLGLANGHWREAMAQFSQDESSKQYRVSSPPPYSVKLPDLGDVNGPGALVKLVHESDGEVGDFAHYWLFQAPSKAAAMAFLRKTTVTAAGEYVIVQTPEGHWGRDARGIYRE